MKTLAERLAMAARLHQAGRLGEAEAIYREILASAPSHAHTLHLLGLVASQTGRHAEAIELITCAIAFGGPNALFYRNLAAVFLAVGRLDEAVAYCGEAIRLAPDDAGAHNNLGVALMRQVHYDEAAAALREAIRLNPAMVDAQNNLGALLQKQGKLNDALACLLDAVRHAPSHAQIRNNLGATLLAGNQPALAEQHLREAVRLQPEYAEAWSNLGLALRDAGKVEESMGSFQKALAANPRHAGAHCNLGYTHEFQGRIDEAKAEFLEALRIDPSDVRALAALSGLAAEGYYDFTGDQLQQVAALVERTDLSAEDLNRAHFALARTHELAGAFDRAFEHYRLGNEIRKDYVRFRGAAFNPDEHRRSIDRLIAVFTPQYFERVRSFGLNTELPIFIVGMMRSGTTLVEQILASHPEVHGAGELREFGLLAAALPQRLRTGQSYPECVEQMDAGTIRTLAEEHLAGLCERGGGAVRVVDKLPINFLYLGLIATLFPRARVVHCRRDPIDTCVSCYLQNFGDPHPFTLDLAHLGMYYGEYRRLMEHWSRVLPLPILELCYEDLIAEQESVSRRLLAACGLPWDDRCLRFHETARAVRTASTLQVRKPIYPSAVGRWRRYERHLGPLLEALRQAEA